MFGVVVAIFMVCWAPYHIYFILSFHFPHITRKEWISNVYLAVRSSLDTLVAELVQLADPYFLLQNPILSFEGTLERPNRNKDLNKSEEEKF